MSIQKLKDRIKHAEKNHLGGQRLSLREMRDILSEFEIEKQRASELSDTFWGRTCARETKRANVAEAGLKNALTQADVDRIVPAIDPVGLYEDLHHCEYTLYVDRTRIRKELAAFIAGGSDNEPVK